MIDQTVRFVTLSELIYINGCVLDDAAIRTGRRKVRDLALLEAAQQRPQASAFGADAYPTLHDKAAALLHALARNHPFTDGNKRTAATACVFMLRINGRCVTWDQAEALERILAAAENRIAVPALAAWLPTADCTPYPEPDAERDAALIAAILVEQKWLLDELARR
ncbi:MAG: type II toxin-antitoxin system death-on-curing family toxin [Candidatus Flexifilum sp.]|jgi:death-on-curing protein